MTARFVSLHETDQLVAAQRPTGPARARFGLEQPLDPVDQGADLLVRLDPRWRHSGIPEHPVGERPLAGRAVVPEGQPLALVGQIVERAFLHRLPDLAVDQRLARRRIRVRVVAPLVAHVAIVARRQGPCEPEFALTGKLTRVPAKVASGG